ncbi:S1 domain-containing post-transcriptional regulator GSP13 [Tuberibacillus sp. Marseille-P3662]|uniref:S1 domain-containing post-transcriptional regulator GSP13 n=1 Tax=Tuberibacillus sp. Marseille-P3662 TaxID=1965358 RepID=UPI000A1CC8C8|nr:S1 domain-containing post-transcriptional regulator GSP13 [Tuberibacillus sp. Marseille-P3662]
MQDVNVGDIVEGKVTGIKPFGAFVAINENQQGLVHISEISHEYVKDINEHLSVGDSVNVKVIKIDEDAGKVSLSIRATQPKPQSQSKPPKREKQQSADKPGFNTLEAKLKDWLKESNEKQAQLNKRLNK